MAGAMAQLLGTPIGFSEDLCSAFSIYMVAYNHLELQFLEICHPILTSINARHEHGAYTYIFTGKTLIHVKYN